MKIIVEEVFPKIIDTHIRTRSPVESTKKSLERYHAMGLQAIRHLPPDTQEENRQALDLACQAALKRLDEFHSQETSVEASLPKDSIESR